MFQMYSSTSKIGLSSPLGVYDADFRDNVNDWIENQIAQVQMRRRVTTTDPVERDMLTLFRYLAIFGRCVNPYSVKDSFKVDSDLREYLEVCICKSLGRLLDTPESDTPTRSSHY